MFTANRACFKFVFFALSFVFSLESANARQYFENANQSSSPHPYYGKDLYEQVKQGTRDRELAEMLHHILSAAHIPKKNDFDEIVNNCKGNSCYFHRSLGYDQARVVLMGRIHLEQVNRVFFIMDVYCEHPYKAGDFPRNRGPGPDKIPDSNILNTEHTWPQSHFTNKFPAGMQKSDLHHLYPSDSQANGIRGNFEFGEVDAKSRDVCVASKFGKINGAPGYFFEPPPSHRGNVARALFYFAIRYRMTIGKVEEHFLRKWHRADPVDEFEMFRNDQIHRIQGNRNPFIDHPELVNYISDF